MLRLKVIWWLILSVFGLSLFSCGGGGGGGQDTVPTVAQMAGGAGHTEQ